MSNEEYEVVEHPLYPGGLPTWRFSPWDMAYVAVATLGGLFNTLGQGLGMLGREFNAAANFSRDKKNNAEEWDFYENRQRALAKELENTFGFQAFQEPEQ